MLEALATVSSLAFMAVIDFLLAYFGGDWLDRHLAIVSLVMTYYNLIQRSVLSRDTEHKKDEK